MFGHTYTPSGSTKGHSHSDPIVVKPPDSQTTPAVQVIVVSARFWLHWTLLVKEANLYSLAPLLNRIWNKMVVRDNSSLELLRHSPISRLPRVAVTAEKTRSREWTLHLRASCFITYDVMAAGTLGQTPSTTSPYLTWHELQAEVQVMTGSDY